jgi:hypothetical protein
MSLDMDDDFVSCRRSEVLDLVPSVESGAPSPAEFGDTFRQQLHFAVVVR